MERSNRFGNFSFFLLAPSQDITAEERTTSGKPPGTGQRDSSFMQLQGQNMMLSIIIHLLLVSDMLNSPVCGLYRNVEVVALNKAIFKISASAFALMFVPFVHLWIEKETNKQIKISISSHIRMYGWKSKLLILENKPTKTKLSLSIPTPLHLDPFMQIPAQVDITVVLLPLL